MSASPDDPWRQSIVGAMVRTGESPARARQSGSLLVVLVLVALWAFLAYPVGDLASRSWPAVVVPIASVLLVGFALLWTRTMWLSLATRAGSGRVVPWFVATAALGVPLAFWTGTAGFDALFIYVSIAAAVSLPMRLTVPAVVTVTGVAWIFLSRVPGGLGQGVVLGQLSFVFWLAMMMLFYRRMMTLVIELRAAREELAGLAVADERLRMARDLHDVLGQSLSTISLKAQLAQRLMSGEGTAAAEVADIETVAVHALAEVREVVTGYRQPSLATELAGARRLLDAAGIDVRVQADELDVPPRTEALLGWVLREAVTNVVRHSRGTACRIEVSSRGPDVVVAVRDDGGSGGAPVARPPGQAQGHGLTGLAERVEAVGGTVRFGPPGLTGTGFSVTAVLPLGAAS